MTNYTVVHVNRTTREATPLRTGCTLMEAVADVQARRRGDPTRSKDAVRDRLHEARAGWYEIRADGAGDDTC